MTILFALLLTVLVFAFVSYPLLKRRSYSGDPADTDELGELYSKRDTTYSMIKELEFDLQSGTLNEADHEDLSEKYKTKAVSLLRDIDNVEQGSDVEMEIEKQILELRRGKGRFCSQCVVKVQGSDRFCSQCGTSLS